MPILFDKKNKVFKLDGKSISYAIKLLPGGVVSHLYFGSYINDTNLDFLVRFKDRGFSGNPLEAYGDRGYSLDTALQEYPGFGVGDYRTSAIAITLPDGSTATDMRYKSHKIYKGKLSLSPLPSSFANEDEAETLEITLFDKTSNVEVNLLYTAFKNQDIITRSVLVRNLSQDTVFINRVLSACVDFYHSDFHMMTLFGRWACERNVERHPLHNGVSLIESLRGNSSHHYNPFFALVSPNATEETGEAYGFSLVYSGNFVALCDVDGINQTRAAIGINPTDFKWKLEPNESFTAPEVVLTYSQQGIGKMSRNYHRFFNKHMCRDFDKKRPVVINNWEATYFDFNSEKLLAIADEAAGLGIDMLVLDDGWYGNRNNDKTSLGDWYVNEEKITGGLSALANSVNAKGLALGLWIEPEMISEQSNLYKAHPDWCLHVHNRHKQESRSQLALDLSREDVRNYLYNAISGILESANIEYIKWDINRSLSEVQSFTATADRQRETWHRNMLGVYELFERIRERFPNILIEGCCGGGGRFDPAMLYIAPQHWTSDNTDPVERTKIQYGTSMVYPLSVMSSHVSQSPNHQTNRRTTLKTRGDVAFTGAFGYELDLEQIDEEEKHIIRQQIKEYRQLEGLIRNGDFYRLVSPFETNNAAWCIADEDRAELYFTFIQFLTQPNQPLYRIRIPCADGSKWYKDEKTGDVYSGLVLKHAGLAIPELFGDYLTYTCHLKEVDANER